jgi:hypothetical protein
VTVPRIVSDEVAARAADAIGKFPLAAIRPRAAIRHGRRSALPAVGPTFEQVARGAVALALDERARGVRVLPRVRLGGSVEIGGAS